MVPRSFQVLLFPFLLLSTIALNPLLAAEDEKSIQARRQMVELDIKGRGIRDKTILTVMQKVPRHLFVPKNLRNRAYGDHPLPIGEGQTISQPYVVALMTEALQLKGGEKVLEIGTGSGYQAAVLAEIVKEVYTIEIRKTLATRAEETLRDLGYGNVKVRQADGYFGWKEYAPFDAIIITASTNHIPPVLLQQLRKGGRLILPLGSTVYAQVLTLVRKRDGELDVEQLGAVAFVPMVGEAKK